jgi:hypothetical protein
MYLHTGCWCDVHLDIADIQLGAISRAVPLAGSGVPWPTSLTVTVDKPGAERQRLTRLVQRHIRHRQGVTVMCTDAPFRRQAIPDSVLILGGRRRNRAESKREEAGTQRQQAALGA